MRFEADGRPDDPYPYTGPRPFAPDSRPAGVVRKMAEPWKKPEPRRAAS